MCFSIPRKNFLAKLAKEDIICYKKVFYSKEKIIASEHELFNYKLNTLYKEKRFKKISIMSDDSVYEGFHSFIVKPFRKSQAGLAYVLCVIPKGSLYWQNDSCNEYVSNRIILKEIINE